ncbi:MAG: hypothetical protein VX246_12345 [Myxococcota bacterium]|nr:hypothetical protein [Myxococcota bacterium]
MTKPQLLVRISLALLCCVAAFPYLGLLPLGPVALDSAEWIARGSTTNPDWREWVFATQHFGVGYRPVAALSFTINQGVGGFAPWIFRTTDLLIHLVSGLLVYTLYVALTHRDARRHLGGIVAAAIFLAHPAVQDVLPILARRSYLLANFFSLAALCVFARSLARHGMEASAGPGIASGLLLSLALFSNESSAISIVLVPAVAATVLATTAWRNLLAASAVPLAISGFAVALRLTLLGGVGGYDVGAFSLTRAGAICAAAWQGISGANGVEAAPGLVALLFLLISAIGFRTVRSFSQLDESGNAALLLGAAWLTGTTVLYASQGVWYPRQTYLMLAPLALVVSALAVGTLGTDARAWFERAPALLLCGVLLWLSPVSRGVDALLLDRLEARNARITEMKRVVDSAEAPALVQLVIPFRRSEGPQNPLRAGTAPELHRDYFTAEVWLNALLRGAPTRVANLVFYEATEGAAPSFAPATSAQPATLQLDTRGYRVGGTTAEPAVSETPSPTQIRLERKTPPDVAEYLLILVEGRAQLYPL